MGQAKAGQSSPSFDGKRIFPTPSYEDKIVVEVVSLKLEDYAEIPYGTAHPQTTLFPNHRLVLQVEQNEENVVRYYAADRATQQAYNANVSYSGESASHPIFTRDYLIRRSAYASTSRLSPLSGLVDADVTAGGTGYDPKPGETTATLSGGTGSGGAVGVIVSPAGVVIGLYITAVGNYTVAPNITIVGTGTGATGTLSIQPQTAVLVKEDLAAKTGDERVDGLYALVRYAYETLPGPWIPDAYYDRERGAVQLQRRAVINTSQVSSLTSTIETTYKGRDGSSIVLWEIQEIFGAGVTGFSAYPILTGASRTVDVRGRTVDTASTIVAHGAGPDVASLNISSVVKDRNNQIADKMTVSIASLPADEVVAYWDWVNLPLCVLDIVHTVFCNLSSQATLRTNYDTQAGSAVLRKHRRTVSYSTTPPDTTPNLSGAAFETADLKYQGRIISINLSNVLNDAISYTANFSTTAAETCIWTEDYTFPATSPTATTFLAGAWYTKSFRAEPFGQSMWKITKDEYYSASGNPAI